MSMATYTARAVTKHAVLQVNQNRDPEFPVASVTRYIAENSPSETYVGGPLPLATDPDGGVLIYALMGDDVGLFELLVVPAADGANIAGQRAPTDDGTIYPVSGMDVVLQLRAADLIAANLLDEPGNFGTEFNHEDDDLNSYEVILEVSDDGDHKDTLTVNIMVTNRNEAPNTPRAAPKAPPAPEIMGNPAVEHAENDEEMVATYSVANAPADETVTWSLGGDDVGAFDIDQDGEVTFSRVPDYERSGG